MTKCKQFNILFIFLLYGILNSHNLQSEESAKPLTLKEKYLKDSILRIEIRSPKQKYKKIFEEGSGFFISREGQLLTSYSLIKRAIKSPQINRVFAIDHEGIEISEILLGPCDQKIDLCLLKANYTIEKPLQIEKKKLQIQMPIHSVLIRDKQSLTLNSGIILSFKSKHSIEYIKSSIPYSKSSLGTPLLNENGTLIGMLTKSENYGNYNNKSFAITSQSITNFLKKKQKFTAFLKKKKRMKKSGLAKNMKSLEKHFNKLFKELKNLKKQPSRTKQQKETEKKVKSVKLLMEQKEQIKVLKQAKYKELIKEQSNLSEWENKNKKGIDEIKAREEEIMALQNLNRSQTLKIVRNKTKMLSSQNDEEKKLLKKSNQLTKENISLTDAKIKLLQTRLRETRERNSSSLKQRSIINGRIKTINNKLESYDGEIEQLNADAFDYFNDAI